MADMMAFHDAEHGDLLARLASAYEVITEPDTLSYSEGDRLTVYGYPDHGDAWPYSPARIDSGPIIRMNPLGPMLEARIDPRQGFSGGPVFTDDGLCVGMMIGSTDGVGRIVPLHVLNRL